MLLLLVILGKAGGHPTKAKIPFDHPPLLDTATPRQWCNHCSQFDGCPTDSTRTIRSYWQHFVWEPLSLQECCHAKCNNRPAAFLSLNTVCLGGLATSSPHGSSLFLLTAVEHSTYNHILFFRSLVSGYPGCFQFFEITSNANDRGDGDNVSMVKQPNIHQIVSQKLKYFQEMTFLRNNWTYKLSPTPGLRIPHFP